MSLKERISKIAFFEVTPDLSSLTENERQALKHCVEAARIINDIYLKQVYEFTSALMAVFGESPHEESDLIKCLEVNGGPWDVFKDFEPFLKVGPKPKGSSFYPTGLTVEEWEAWLKSNPGDRESFESNYTVIVRTEDGGLISIPYDQKFGIFLGRAAEELRAAAKLLPKGPLKTFLELRATAFFSNNYFESDMAWVDTNGNPFEITIGPYEVYEDRLLGLKAMFEAFVAIPDEDSTQYLKKFASAVPEFDLMLGKRFGFKPKGAAIPLEVVSDVYRGGECAHGRQFSAYNLPNDRKIHELKGSKKVFSRTMMEAKFEKLLKPIAQRLLRPSDLRYLEFNNRLLFVLGHELAHGLGPNVVIKDGRETSFETALRNLHSSLEEAKADMLGVVLLRHFVEKGLITQDELIGSLVTEVATYPGEWRMSHSAAHALGSLIEYNWLKSHGAVSYNSATGFFDIDPEKCLSAIEELAYEFLRIQSKGDYDEAKVFVEKWGKPALEVAVICARLEDLPIEVHATYKI